MKKVQYSEQPEQYLIRKTDDKNYYVRLRKNTTEKTREDEQGISTYYEANEVEIKIPLMQNVKGYIEENFDALFVANCPELAFSTIKTLEKLLADLTEEVLLGD